MTEARDPSLAGSPVGISDVGRRGVRCHKLLIETLGIEKRIRNYTYPNI